MVSCFNCGAIRLCTMLCWAHRHPPQKQKMDVSVATQFLAIEQKEEKYCSKTWAWGKLGMEIRGAQQQRRLCSIPKIAIFFNQNIETANTVGKLCGSNRKPLLASTDAYIKNWRKAYAHSHLIEQTICGFTHTTYNKPWTPSFHPIFDR